MNKNKYIACYSYETGQNNIWNFEEFKKNFIEILEEIKITDFDPVNDKKEFKMIELYIQDILQIITIEELKEYYHDYDCFFDWTEWNLSEIREIKNEK